MFTTATVDATVSKRGAPRPSGGAGPVRQRDQPLGVRPAEFTDHTFGTQKQRNCEQRTQAYKTPMVSYCGCTDTEKNACNNTHANCPLTAAQHLCSPSDFLTEE